MMTCSQPISRAGSEPGRRRRWRSERFALKLTRGSTTMSFAPALIALRAQRYSAVHLFGCGSWPHMTMQSVRPCQ